MKKRLITILCVAFLSLCSLFSATLTDSFSFLAQDPTFVAFMAAIWSEGSPTKAEQLSQILSNQEGKSQEQSIKKISMDTSLARLYIALGPEYKTKAKTLLERAEQELAKLEDMPYQSLILGSDIDGVWYLLNPRSLAKGIASSKKINTAYKEYPTEVKAQLLKANSMLYAPSFAGGDTKGALNLFLSIQRDGLPLLSKWDLSSLYSGIGYACYKLKDYQNAQGYLAAAKALHPFDAVLDEYIALVEKALL